MKGRAWTVKEEQFLKDNHKQHNIKQLSEMLGRTEFAVRNRKSRLGLNNFEEFAVYKGEDLLVIGTAKECAKELGVSQEYIRWMTTPTAQKRLSGPKRTIAIKLDKEYA